MSFAPSDGSEKQVMRVFEFKNRGGVGMGMYNTDEVCAAELLVVCSSLFADEIDDLN